MRYLTLYILTHKKTGLKYFGKTLKDLEFYFGSGTAWNLHCEEFGYDMNKEIVLHIEYKEENFETIRNIAKKFSINNNIVNDNKWANLINESGVAGFTNYDVAELKNKVTKKSNKKVFKKRFDIQPNTLKMIGKDEISNIKSKLTRGPGTKIVDNSVVIRYDNASRIEDVYSNMKWDLFRNSKAIDKDTEVILIPINGLKEIGIKFKAAGKTYDITKNLDWSDRLVNY